MKNLIELKIEARATALVFSLLASYLPTSNIQGTLQFNN